MKANRPKKRRAKCHMSVNEVGAFLGTGRRPTRLWNLLLQAGLKVRKVENLRRFNDAEVEAIMRAHYQRTGAIPADQWEARRRASRISNAKREAELAKWRCPTCNRLIPKNQRHETPE